VARPKSFELLTPRFVERPRAVPGTRAPISSGSFRSKSPPVGCLCTTRGRNLTRVEIDRIGRSLIEQHLRQMSSVISCQTRRMGGQPVCIFASLPRD
jgi:hypothetical protein